MIATAFGVESVTIGREVIEPGESMRPVSSHNCPTEAELRDYAAGNLSNDQLIAIDDHLEDCCTCRDALGNLQSVDDALDIEFRRGDHKSPLHRGDASSLTLSGHNYAVTAVTFSEDGKRLASGGTRLRIWDTETGETSGASTNQFLGAIRSLAFDSSDERIVGAHYFVTRLWDANNAAELIHSAGHPAPIAKISISPDGQSVMTAGRFGWGFVWDLATGREIHSYPRRIGSPSNIRYLPDGKRILASRFTVLDAHSDRVLETWESVKDSPHFEVSPDGQLAAFRMTDNTIAIVETKTGSIQCRTEPFDGTITMAFQPDGQQLCIGLNNERLVLLDSKTGERRGQIKANTHGAYQLAFDPSHPGRLLRCLSTIDILNTNGSAELRQFESTPGIYWHHIAFSPDGRRLAAAGHDQADGNWIVGIFDMQTRQLTHRIDLSSAIGLIHDITFTPDGRHIITANSNGTAYVLRITNPETITTVTTDSR